MSCILQLTTKHSFHCLKGSTFHPVWCKQVMASLERPLLNFVYIALGPGANETDALGTSLQEQNKHASVIFSIHISTAATVQEI